MALVKPFINIYRTKEEAFYFRNSPINSQFIFRGVQLLPNNSAKYVQITNTPDGINLEDWAVFVVNLCTGEKTDITDYFLVETLTNSANGNPQFYWSLKNIPFDFGWDLVYLEITQTLGETFYSTPFQITNIESEYTNQFHYKETKDEVYQSIGLQAWYLDEDLKTEITTGYKISKNQTVIKNKQETYLHLFRTQSIAKNVAIQLDRVICSPICYINYIRYYLTESIEIPEKSAQENFVTLNFSVSPDFDDNFFGLADYNGVDYGSEDYDTDAPSPPISARIHSNVYSSVYN